MQQPTQHDRPPYAHFYVYSREVRDVNGMPSFEDVHMVRLTRPGQKDSVEKEVAQWMDDLKRRANDGGVPVHWPMEAQKAFTAWKENQEIPSVGTPIKGWPLLSPAQINSILAVGIRTVEDLAQISDEARMHLGMGANNYQLMAQRFLEDKAKGADAARFATLERDNAELKTKLEEAIKAIKSLTEKPQGRTKETA